ncbi:MAG: hypothetical protein VR65_15525 [Desulfobulbaceae bacterium BRH_c16a]|nr:MAG: hypothetical protein VR65_15525 [Desulfobulbaceae bacterium BRH_c16a]
MKESIGYFNQDLDSQLKIEDACSKCKGKLVKKGKGLKLLLKKHVFSGLATCAVGGIMFGSIVLFFQQLAEYGW